MNDTMVLHLFHGRDDPHDDMDGWGYDGPRLRIGGLHVTYMADLIVFMENDINMHLHNSNGCIYYDGSYYGDWEVLPATPEEEERNWMEIPDPEKAHLGPRPGPTPIDTQREHLD